MNRTHRILAPMSGTLTPLQQVPDQIFSKGLLGEGIAILPEDGKILAPVDGVISAVMDTLHAYGFETEDGLELLVHVGLGSLTLRGEAFRCHVTIGQQVKTGDQKSPAAGQRQLDEDERAAIARMMQEVQ